MQFLLNAGKSSRLLCLALGVALLGCREQQPIRSYIVPDLPEDARGVTASGSGLPKMPAEPTGPAAPQGDPTHRMLAAVAKGPDQAWFFKLTAPSDAAAKVAEQVNALLDSIRFDEDNLPTWKLPNGWTDRGKSGMRHTTLLIPYQDQQLELSVSALALGSNWKASLLANINRWRGQMQQPPLKATELADGTRPLDDVSEGSVAVDIAGWSGASGRMPPFAGGASAAPRPDAPTPTPTPPANRSPNKISYKTPAGWVDDSPKPMRAASLRTADADDAAVVTASAFPTHGMMGDPLANVNRWRGQVGLPPIDTPTLDEQSEPITIGGVDGFYARLKGESSSILVAMVTRDGLAWFFKLVGDSATIDNHSDAFRQWLASVQFAGGEEPSAPAGPPAPAVDADEPKSDTPAPAPDPDDPSADASDEQDADEGEPAAEQPTQEQPTDNEPSEQTADQSEE